VERRDEQRMLFDPLRVRRFANCAFGRITMTAVALRRREPSLGDQ
jgi:hypothetical protein